MSNWPCPRCSFLNHPELFLCEICEFSKPPEALLSTKETESEKEKKIARLMPPAPQPNLDSPVRGLLELILKQKVTTGSLHYQICNPPCDHYSQKGSYGAKWSCGYRNIQMLCSSLMQLDEYKMVLFNKNGDIPDTITMQRWIERAWSAGFDREGAEQLGGKLVGTRTWIGTTECAALLRFFGIRAIIVDFPTENPIAARGNNVATEISMAERLCGWVDRYFKERGAPICTLSPTTNTENKNNNLNTNSSLNSHVVMTSVTTTHSAAITAGTNANKLTPTPDFIDLTADDTTTNTSTTDIINTDVATKTTTTAASTTTARIDDAAGPVSAIASDDTTTVGAIPVNHCSASDLFVPPLYFQYQGHSRTIAGLHHGTAVSTNCGPLELVNMIVFDPSNDPSIALRSLESGTWRWRSQLLKHRSGFREDAYQLLYIAPGIMSESERHSSKLLVGKLEHEPLHLHL